MFGHYLECLPRVSCGLCMYICMRVCTLYNVRGDQDSCSQPYLTSSQSCYIKNRDFARAL